MPTHINLEKWATVTPIAETVLVPVCNIIEQTPLTYHVRGLFEKKKKKILSSWKPINKHIYETACIEIIKKTKILFKKKCFEIMNQYLYVVWSTLIKKKKGKKNMQRWRNRLGRYKFIVSFIYITCEWAKWSIHCQLHQGNFNINIFQCTA